MAKTGQNSFCYTPGQGRFLKNGTPVFDPPLPTIITFGSCLPHEPNLSHLGRSRASAAGSTSGRLIARGHEEPESKARTWHKRSLLSRRGGSTPPARPPRHRGKLPRLLWVRGAQEKARRLQVQTNPPMWLDGP